MDGEAIVAREAGLHHSLTTNQISMIAIGGAIGTGLFLGSAFAIGLAGPAVLVSYTIGAVIALLLAVALTEMAVAQPTPGSFGVYAHEYLGPMAGFIVRYAYWSGVMLAVGMEVSAGALFMKFWFPEAPAWWWTIGFSVGLIAMNAIEVKVFGALEFVFSMIKVVAILAFIILGAVLVFGAQPASGIGLSNLVSHGGFFPNGLWGMWLAVIVAILSYLGLETISVAAGEAKEPTKAVIGAFRATIFRLVFFYLATLTLMLAIVPWTVAGTSGSPFVKVMQATGIPGAAGVINFVILIAALSAMNSLLYGSTRIMFSLSRAGFAPAALGRLSKQGVPLGALAVSCIGIVLAVVLSAVSPDKAFPIMAAISLFGAMFAWMMIFLIHLAFRRKVDAKTMAFRVWGHPFGSILGAGLMAAILITTAFTPQFGMTLACGIPFLVVLTIAYLVWIKPRMSGQR